MFNINNNSTCLTIFTNDKIFEKFESYSKIIKDRQDQIDKEISQLKAQNPGTPFSQHIQPAIEEVMSRIKFTEGTFDDTVEYRAAPVIKEWTAE